MSRKKTQPKKNVVPDPKFNSTIIPKLINNIMYDGKRGVAAKIVYDAIDNLYILSALPADIPFEIILLFVFFPRCIIFVPVSAF